MSLNNIMSRSVVTVEADDSLWTVKGIFDLHEFHHLLVLEHGRIFGIVSDRDLFKAISPNLGTNVETPRDLATLNKQVHHIMSRNPRVLTEAASIFDAIELFNNHPISCIPVVDEEQRPIGILSWRDVLRAIGERRSMREQGK
jgi:acetoin utilization protein AcuB